MGGEFRVGILFRVVVVRVRLFRVTLFRVRWFRVVARCATLNVYYPKYLTLNSSL